MKIDLNNIKIYLKKISQEKENFLIIEKIRAIKKFINWLRKKRLIEEKNGRQILRFIQKELLKLKIKGLLLKIPFLKEVVLFPQKPEKKFVFNEKGLGIEHYLAFSLLLIFMAGLGAGLYNQFFKKAETPFAYPLQPIRGGRMLSFQGRLTDSLGNPITTSTNVQFRLWKVASGGNEGTCSGQSGEDCLYKTGSCVILPDQDGIFSVLIGQECGGEIPNSVFTENANVYLGVTVGTDSEMTPRQQIANVGYAINAETLQGLPPGTTTSTIPYINKDGNLLIAVANPAIRSTYTSASFTISSANTAILQSAGTGDVILQATESGSIKLRTGGDTDANNRLVISNTGVISIPSLTTGVVQTNASGQLSSIIGTSGYFPKWSAMGLTTTSNIYENISGNVGIGTNSPSARLEVQGSEIGNTILRLKGVANQTAPFISVFNSSNSELLTLNAEGNLGIGTTSPSKKLHVEGECVAEDSLIPVLKIQNTKCKNQNDNEKCKIFKYVPIKDVKPGDYVLSLNEKTGNFEWQKVEKTLDKGWQQVYELITETGKRIETTGNHPYLVRQSKTKEDLTRRPLSGEFSKENKSQKQGNQSQSHTNVYSSSKISQVNHNSSRISSILTANNKQRIASNKENVNTKTLLTVNGSINNPDPILVNIADKILSWETRRFIENRIEKIVDKDKEIVNNEWKKVIYLKVGDEIAVVSDHLQNREINSEESGKKQFGGVKWEKIVSIRKTGIKHVYDLQIANTHNFVANGIVAHNTYLNGQTTVGGHLLPSSNNSYDLGSSSYRWRNLYYSGSLFGPESGISGYWQRNSQALSPTYITDDVLLGATATSSALIRLPGTSNQNIWFNTGGNVGIGTTNPSSKLEVRGSTNNNIASALNITNSSGTSLFYVRNDGKIGIGTNNPDSNYTVTIGKNDGSSYGVLINRYPTSYFSGSPGLRIADYVTSGPSSGADGAGGLLNVGFPNLCDESSSNPESPCYSSSENSYYASLVNVFNKSGSALKVSGNRNVFIGYQPSSYFPSSSKNLFVEGKVGIGFASPSVSAVLNIYEPNVSSSLSDFTQNINRAGILITTDYSADTYTPGIFWNTSNNNSNKPKAGIWLSQHPSGTKLYLGTSNTYSTGITNQAITIDWNGNVGVGTTNPSSKLEVRGSTSDNTASALNVINSGGTSLLYVRNDGNVGIGTTGPNSKLHVVGDIRHTGNLISQGPNYASTWMSFDEDQYGNSLLLGSGGLTVIGGGESTSQVRGNIGVNDERLVLASDNTGTSIAHHFITNLQNGWANRIDAMVILGNGNVGIGTTNPSHRLSVVGSQTEPTYGSNLIVNGDFSNGSAGWTVGQGWTITDQATHSTGYTQPLSQDISVTNNTTYQIEWTQTGATAGSLTFSIGSVSSRAIAYWEPTKTTITASGSGTQTFSITPSSDYNGSIDNITVRAITSYSQPVFSLLNTDQTIGLEIRTGGTGNYNTFVGLGAGSRNTGGIYNTALGYQAIFSNTTGYHNTALGFRSLYSNTTGNYNTALGSFALYSNNTGLFNVAVGSSVLYSNTTGFSNSALGHNSLYSLTTGFENVALGVNAGRYLSNGSSPNQTSNRSVYLGVNTKASADGATNEIVIGYNAVGSGSNSATYGNTSITKHIFQAGNVGIGTTNPGSGYKLDVNGNIAVNSSIYFDANDYLFYDRANNQYNFRIGEFTYVNWNSSYMNFGYVPVFTVYDSGGVFIGNNPSNPGLGNLVVTGNVGIGTTDLNSKLTVNSNSAADIGTFLSGSTSNYGAIVLGRSTPEFRIGIAANYGNYASNAQIGDAVIRVEDSSKKLHLLTGSGVAVLTITNSNVGIGTTNPNTSKLHVYNLPGTSSYSLVRVNTANGAFYYDTSTQKNKLYIQDFNDDFEKILSIKPKIYIDKTSGIQEIGYIAEDFHNLGLNHLVVYDQNNLPLGLHYEKIPLYLLEIIKKQNERFKFLEKDLSLTSTGDLQIVKPQNEYVYDGNLDYQSQISNLKTQIYNLKLKTGEIIDRIGAFAEIVVGKIKSGLIEAENIIINNTLLAKNIIAENINLTTENLTIAGKKLKDYITQIVNQTIDQRLLSFQSEKIISPVIETDQINLTSQISKLKTTSQNSKLEITDNQNQQVAEFKTDEKETILTGSLEVKSDQNKGKLAQIILKGLEGKTAASIDAAGNASFSGRLSSSSFVSDLADLGNLNVYNHATISGALYAAEASVSGKLVAKEIESENLNSLTHQLVNTKEDINEIQKLLADIKNQSLPNLNNQTNLSNITDLTNLTITGHANLYQATITNSLAVGNLFLENDKILSLSWELNLSALSKINFFDGAVTIAKDGTITTKGKIIAQGGIQTPRIILDKDNPLQIKSQSDETVASFDHSGSVFVKRLELEKFYPASLEAKIVAPLENFKKNGIFAYALETASSSAGIGMLPENSQEIIIYNKNVKKDSLVYITPVGYTTLKLSVAEKNDGYFRVITDQMIHPPIKFDWLIIN